MRSHHCGTVLRPSALRTHAKLARTADQRRTSRCRAVALDAGHWPLSCALGMCLRSTKPGREPAANRTESPPRGLRQAAVL